MKSLKAILGICLATAGLGGAIAVGAVSTQNTSVERVDAGGGHPGSIIIQKNDNDMKYTGSKLVAYFYDSNSHSAWGDAVWNDGHKYQEYTWDLTFDPTTIIILRVNGSSWSSGDPWSNVWCRTGNVSLSGADVIWMNGDSSQSSGHGTYAVDAVVKGGTSDSWSVATVDTKLSNYKVSGSDTLEAYGEVTLPANTYFKVVKTGNTWCGSYTAHDLIKSNFSGGGDSNIHNTSAGTYEFYFDYDTQTTYITDPALAAADEWAQYFLAHVGCDSTGVNLPTGWSACATEYGKLSDAAKNKVYAAEAKVGGTYVEQAVARYDKAISSHPSLTKFIVNSGGTPRATNNVVIATKFKENNIAFVVVAAVAIAALSTGAYILLRKKKHN